MSDESRYLDELARALARRGLDASRTGDAIREAAAHCAQSGESPRDAFGEPEHYAAALLAAEAGDEGAAPGYEARTFRATVTDELEILADLGRNGWELTGVRDFGLHARRPVLAEERTTWEHARRTGVRRAPIVAEMQAGCWTPCGRWLTFHYFKRATAPSPAASS